jgi:hypothetical protein
VPVSVLVRVVNLELKNIFYSKRSDSSNIFSNKRLVSTKISSFKEFDMLFVLFEQIFEIT